MRYNKQERIWTWTQAEYRRKESTDGKVSRREWEAEINKREVEREGMYSQWRYKWPNGPVADISRRKRRETSICSELKREVTVHGIGTLNIGDLSKETALQEESLQPLRGCFQVIWAFVASFSTAGNIPSLKSWHQMENPWFTLQKERSAHLSVTSINEQLWSIWAAAMWQHSRLFFSILKQDPSEWPLFCQFSRHAVWYVYCLGSCRRQNAEWGQVGSQAHCG